MRHSRTSALLLLGASLLGAAVACTGDIGGLGESPGPNGAGAGHPGGGNSTGGAGSMPGPGSTACEPTAPPGVTPLLKLSTTQYRNTVRDLLVASGAGKLTSAVGPLMAAVPDDSLGSSFRVLDDRISLEHVQAYFNVGVAVGNAIRDDAELLRAVGGECALAPALTDACVTSFANGFLRRAYRRPLSTTEVADLKALNDGVRTPAEAIRAMIVVTLSSPRFVNHVEIDGAAVGGKEDLLELTPYETASRLSYLFWQTMPDDALFAAAEDGSLATEAGFAEQLDRVFQDSRTHETLWGFWNEWFRLEKFTGFETTRPGFQSLTKGVPVGAAGHDFYADMTQEIRDLTELFTFGASHTVAELLTTDLSVTRSADLAALYGASPWSGTGDYPKLPAGTRAGILQRSALLVSNLELTNPFHRGALVRRNILCDTLAQPDPNSLPPGSLDPPPVTAAQTTRERYQAKIEGKNLCLGCHTQFADMGYVLESFDALGRHRTVEHVYDEKTGAELAQLPIDTKGIAHVTPDDERPVANVAELTQRIVESRKVEACMASKYFSFATRRVAEGGSFDMCAVQSLGNALEDPKGGLGAAFRNVALQATFARRKVGRQ